ncbi:MAG: ABC transporter permease [Acidimicrobiia bacterium]|nr:ABC transporter permease [Acidimicrobiia bacterium]
MATDSFTLPRSSPVHHSRRQLQIVWHLVVQSFNAKYRRASLGVLWVWAEPVMRMLVFVLVFEKALGIRTGDENQAVYLFVGILFVRAATAGLNTATTSPLSNQALVNMAGVDRRIFPMIAIANSFVDLILSIPLIWVLLVVQGLSIPFDTIVLTIPILIIQYLLMLGAGFVLAAANVRVRDVNLLVQSSTVMLFYLSPTFWSPETIEGSGFEWIVDVNPLAAILMAQRDVLAWGVVPELGPLLYASAWAIGLLAIGLPLYKRVSLTMADYL